MPSSKAFKEKYQTQPAELLTILAENTSITPTEVSIPEEIVQSIIQKQSWIQILNEVGKEVYSYNKPEGIPVAYAPGELIAYKVSSIKGGYELYTWFEDKHPLRLTWIYGKVYEESIYNSYTFWGIIVVIYIVFAMGIAMCFGAYLGRPLIHILNWIHALSKKQYKEPVDQKGCPIFINPQNNRIRHCFKTYDEIIHAVQVLTQNLEDAKQQRQLLEQSREEWIAGVSHDMKTPLSSVKGYADLLSAKNYDFSRAEVMEYASIISSKASYMENLIEDLNLTCHLNNKALPIQCEKKEVVEVVRRTIIELMNNKVFEGRSIELEGGEEELFCFIDERWFKRAIDNLLINATTHNKPQAKIRVKIHKILSEKQEENVKITISDNGEGIEEQTLARIFDRYYRGTNTKDCAIKGSGLGLAIAKELIEVHGGSISVESELKVGTTFSILLPSQN